MTFIDFRFRPNIPSTVQGMIDHPVFGEMHALFKFHERARSQPIEDIVRDMEAQNVVKGVITSRDEETTYGIASGNKGVIPFLEQYPDRFIGMAGLDPHKGMDAIDELGLMVETHGFRGAAIDPFLAKIPANHAKYYPIYAKFCEFDIPVVISTGMATLVDGADPEHCHPRYIDAVARDFPKLKIVVSHGCYPWVNEIIMVVQRLSGAFRVRAVAVLRRLHSGREHHDRRQGDLRQRPSVSRLQGADRAVQETAFQPAGA